MTNPGRPTAVRALVRRSVLVLCVVGAAVAAWIAGSPSKPDSQAGGMEAGTARVAFDASGAARVEWEGGAVDVPAPASGKAVLDRERWRLALRGATEGAHPLGIDLTLEVVAPPQTPWARVRGLLVAAEPAFRFARLSLDGRSWQGLVLARPGLAAVRDPLVWCPGPGGPDEYPYGSIPDGSVSLRLTRGGSDGPPDGWILVSVDWRDTVHVPPAIGAGPESYAALGRAVRERAAAAGAYEVVVRGGEVDLPVPGGDSVPFHVVVGTLAAVRPALASLVLLLPADEEAGGAGR